MKPMELLNAIENTAVAAWVRESSSIWSYPTIIFLHSLGLSIVVGLNAAIDLRLLGFAPRLPIAPLAKLFPLMWVGFWINALSGIPLLAADISTFLIAPIFYLKLGLVVLAVVNLRMIHRRVFKNPVPAVGSVPAGGRMLAATSLFLWAGAISAGRLTAYLGPAVALKGITH